MVAMLSRKPSVALAIVASFWCAAPAGAAVTLGVGSPTAVLSNFGPGRTATGTGTVTVTAVLTSWTLTVSDASGNAGHLVPAATGCAGAATQTANALRVSVSGLLGSTTSAGPKTVSGSEQTVASGNGSDALTASYSLIVGSTERMPTGCVFSTPVTWTVQ
jgi:hypothetical protein